MYAAYTLFKDAGEILLPSYKSAAFAQTLLSNIKKIRKESYGLIAKSKFHTMEGCETSKRNIWVLRRETGSVWTRGYILIWFLLLG